MKNKKNIYVSPSFEVIETKCEDVISTSGFNGDDHILGGAAPTSAYEVE